MSFDERVLALVVKVPAGRVTSYGEIACALGNIRLSRAVGGALNRNRKPVTIPCHRVVCSDGRIGGYRGGVRAKIRLLESEGVRIREGKVACFASLLVTSAELLSS